MATQSQPCKREQNGRREALGKPSNAVVIPTCVASIESSPLKSDKAALFNPVPVKDPSGKYAAFVVRYGDGYSIVMETGEYINPWTRRPFTTVESAKKNAKYVLRCGHWPEFASNFPCRPSIAE